MTENQLRDWLDTYGRAWTSRDPDLAATLFSDDSAYHETPFGDPARGRSGVQQYWAAATNGQRDIIFRHEVIAMTGSTGVARWSAEFTRTASGAHVQLDGVFVLEFDEARLCRQLREWWHRREQGT